MTWSIVWDYMLNVLDHLLTRRQFVGMSLLNWIHERLMQVSCITNDLAELVHTDKGQNPTDHIGSQAA